MALIERIAIGRMRLPSLIILAVLCQAAHGLSIPPEFSDAFWEVEKLIMANERLGAKFLRLGMSDMNKVYT